MADISKITVLDGTTYNIKDASARAEIDTLDSEVVKTVAQTLTSTEKTQARTNIEAADANVYQADKILMPGNTGTAGENSIVMPDADHGADANGEASIHIGQGYSCNRSNNIHIGQRGSPSANLKGRYPWLVDYLDVNGYYVTYTDGSSCLNVGPNQIRNGASAGGVSVGTLNLNKPDTAGWPSFTFGLYNYCKGTSQFLLGVGLKGNTGQVFMCGRDADAGEDDRFVVGNGTVSGTTRTPSIAFRVTKDGDAIAQNKMTVGSDPTNNMDVATKQYVDNHSYWTYNSTTDSIDLIFPS